MKQLMILNLLILAGCISTNLQIESRIKEFTKIVFIDRNAGISKEVENLLYFSDTINKQKEINCYKALIDTIILQKMFVIDKNAEIKIWPQRKYPFRKPMNRSEYKKAKNVFVLKAENYPHPIYFLVKNGKIQSFFAMSKPGMEIYMFVTCN